jgi:glycosidase
MNKQNFSTRFQKSLHTNLYNVQFFGRTVLLALFSILLFSCSKDNSPEDNTPVIPPVTDTMPSQYGTPFAQVVDREDAAIYQVNMRVFSQQGNFQGVIARLDSIKALGANVIYLMPIYPVGKKNAFNSPYCVKNYTSINTEFGTLDDLRSLIDQAHSKEMSVIIDWVSNHTSWDNAWITEHKDWYLQNSSGVIVSPPNMGWNDVAQLNFNNAEMRIAMISAMKYWVYLANVDGFRFDYTDGPPISFWKQAVDSLRNITTHKLLLLAEGARSTNLTAGFDYNFGFAFFGNMKSIFSNNVTVKSIENINTSEYANAANGQQIVRYITNHDVNGSDGTPLELFGGKPGSMAAFIVAAYMKGVPMIYNGQEVGTPFRLVFPFTSANINWSLNPDVTAEYKQIIAFRNSSAAIRRGDLVSYSDKDVCVFTKEFDGEKVLIAVNLRNRIVEYAVPSALVNTVWQNAISGIEYVVNEQITLEPYSYLILN